MIANLHTESVLQEVLEERHRQEAKWGEQNHPDGTGPARMPLLATDVNLDLRTGAELARILRTKCNVTHARGDGTWLDILLEEVGEAMAESDPAKLRAELIQVAAVATAWAEAIDRRTRGEAR